MKFVLKTYFPPFLLLTSLLVLWFVPAHNAHAAKKAEKKATFKTSSTYIPVEVVDSLRVSDINNAIRNLRMEAHSPRSKYILREMQRITDFETSGKKLVNKDHRNLFNIGVAYHNLFLFLKGVGVDNQDFFKKALKYYRLAYKTKSPSRKNSTKLTMAALYASNGDEKTARKLFKQVDMDNFQDEFRKYEALATYHAALGETDDAISSLKSAHGLNSGYTTFWLSVTDDFNRIRDDQQFQELLKKWSVASQNVTRHAPADDELIH